MTMLTQDELNAIKMRIDTASGYSTVGEVVADLSALWLHQRSQELRIADLKARLVVLNDMIDELGQSELD